MWEDAHICCVPDFVICAIDRRAMDKTSAVFRCDTFAPMGGGKEGRIHCRADADRCASVPDGRARLYRGGGEEEDESAIPFINRCMEMRRGKIMG